MTGTETERLKSVVYQVEQAFAHTHFLDWVDMAALVVIAYVLLTGLSRTRAWRMAWGLAVLLAVYWIAGLFLPVLRWAMYQALLPGVVGLMIIFQGELRTFLAQVGGVVARRAPMNPTACATAVQACFRLSRERIGALVAFEQSAPLTDVILTGVALDAVTSEELICSIFAARGPLHDGGVVIAGDRVRAAACQFPISGHLDLGWGLGMRHRAAIGLTEQTDAVCVVVSEETGAVSLAAGGKLQHNLSKETLQETLPTILGETGTAWVKGLFTD
jgi:diadenylate cyclase